MSQVGIESITPRTLDNISYSNQGRNLKTWWDFEDFIGGCTGGGVRMNNWLSGAAGAGANVTDILSTSLRPGILSLDTGTTAAGQSFIYVGQNLVGAFLFGAGTYTFETDIYIPTISAGAEEYTLRVGYGDVGAADFIDGVYFEYDRVVNGINWFCCSASNSARTKNDSGTTLSAGTWYRLKIVVNNSQAYWYINNVLCGLSSTNIPTGAGRNTTAIFQFLKSVGITSRTIQIDWAWLHFDLNATR